MTVLTLSNVKRYSVGAFLPPFPDPDNAMFGQFNPFFAPVSASTFDNVLQTVNVYAFYQSNFGIVKGTIPPRSTLDAVSGVGMCNGNTFTYVFAGNSNPNPSFIETWNTSFELDGSIQTPLMNYISTPIVWFDSPNYSSAVDSRALNGHGIFKSTQFNSDPNNLYCTLHSYNGITNNNYNAFFIDFTSVLDFNGTVTGSYDMFYYADLSGDYHIGFDSAWPGYSNTYFDGVVNNTYQMTPGSGSWNEISFDDANLNTVIAGGNWFELEYLSSSDYAIFFNNAGVMTMIHFTNSLNTYEIIVFDCIDAQAQAIMDDALLNGAIISYSIEQDKFFIGGYNANYPPFQFLISQSGPQSNYTIKDAIRLGCWSPWINVGYIEE